MADRQKDGGPAFPIGDIRGEGIPYLGMTLRQYYKAAALMGLLAGYDDEIRPRDFAGQAADLADAMVNEDEEHNAR